MTSIISANEAKKNLDKLIDEASVSHEPKVVTGERSAAVIISHSDWIDAQEALMVANKKLGTHSLKNTTVPEEDSNHSSQNWPLKYTIMLMIGLLGIMFYANSPDIHGFEVTKDKVFMALIAWCSLLGTSLFISD